MENIYKYKEEEPRSGNTYLRKGGYKENWKIPIYLRYGTEEERWEILIYYKLVE